MRRLDDGIAALSPGYFALVMATGILSLSCELLDLLWAARPLLWINVGAYLVLWLMTIARLARHRARMLDDLRDSARGPGYFTVVAATCILGAQVLVQLDARGLAFALWCAGIALWVVIIYAFFLAMTVRRPAAAGGTPVNGAWLIAVVATQAVAVLGVALAAGLPAGVARDGHLLFCLCMFLLGCLLYLPFITMILDRFAFGIIDATGMTPPFWINMGAVAITTLAGSALLDVSPTWPVLASMRPFIAGFTLLFWAAATWWIPLLVLLGIWRHLVARYPLRYSPDYWALVFPLGMYTAATWRLSHALDLELLRPIPQVFVYVALAAWTITFLGLALRLAGRTVPAPISAE